MTTQKLVDDLKPYLEIDRNGLDEAIERQAALYFRVAEQGALAQSKRDEAKINMDAAFAEACSKARVKAAKNGDKVTEAMIKESAETSTLYKEASQTYLSHKNDAEVLGALEKSFDQRGRMLRELAQLYISGYFQISGAGAVRDRRAQDNREAMQAARERRSRG